MKKCRMNKVLAVLLCLAMLLSLCACGKKDAGNNDNAVVVEQNDPAKDTAQTGGAESTVPAQTESAKDTADQSGTSANGGASGNAVGSSTGKKPSAVKTNATVGGTAAAGAPAAATGAAVAQTPSSAAAETKNDAPAASEQSTAAPAVNVTPITEITEVASEAELLAAMKAEKVSTIKTTQNITLTAPVEVTGSKTISGAKITAASKMDAMYVVAEGASLTIKECVIDAASKAENIVLNNGTASVVNSELKGAKNGALYNNGVMAVNYVTISDCKGTGSGGAAKNHGDMAIKNSTFKNNKTELNGGAIFSSTGSVTKMENCSFSGNTATKGGGAMWINSDVYLKNCIFEDNKSGTYGGAVYLNYTVSGIVESCKFYRNDAAKNEGGGLYAASEKLVLSQVIVDDCYFEKNTCGQYGGGLATSGVMTLTNSKFIACESREHAGGVAPSRGKMLMAGCEIRDCVAADCGGAIRNGGDLTMDNCVLFGNTANGDGGGGYYSTTYGGAIITNTKIENNKVPNGIGGGIYLYASSNSAAGAYVENCQIVNNTAGGNGGGINSMGWIELRNCTIDRCTTKAAGGAICATASNLKMYDCEVTNCSSVKNGGAIRNTGVCYMNGVNFKNNHCEGSAGALYFSVGGRGTLENCVFEKNSTVKSGGAIFAYGTVADGQGIHTFKNCTFKGNTSGSYGGAIRNNARITVIGCDFEDNYTDGRGGAIYCNTIGVMSMSGCKLNRNEADTYGGAMAFGGYTDEESGDATEEEFAGMTAQIKIVNTEMNENHANGAYGGTIYSSGNIGMVNTTITRGYCRQNGGAIQNNGILSAEDCSFHDCYVTGEDVTGDNYCHGGAIYMTNRGSMDLTRCVFDGCTSEHYGGAVHANGKASGNYVNIKGCTFTNNDARWRGGAIGTTAITTVKDCEFAYNTTRERQGGAIFNYSTVNGGVNVPGRLTVDNCDIHDNVSGADGGGIYGAVMSGVPSDTTIRNSKIVNNTAAGYGGGVGIAGYATIESGNEIHDNTPSDGDIYVSSNDFAKLTVKGSSEIESIRLAAGKSITAGKGALDSSTKIYTDGSIGAGESIIEGSGSDANVSSDGRYEVEDGKLVAATYAVTLPDGVTCRGGATSDGKATYGTDYQFRLPSGTYELSVTVGGQKVTVTEGSSRTYTLSGEFITGEVVVTLTPITTPTDLTEDDEAYILNGSDVKVSGALADVLAAAEDNDTVYICKNAALNTAVTLDKPVTLTTTGSSAITVTFSADGKLDIGADVMIQGKKTATLTLNGNGEARTAAGITVTGSGAKLTLGGNLTITGMNNQSKAADDMTNGKGGAVCATSQSSVVVAGAVLENNTSSKDGGAIYVSGAALDVTSGTFNGNTVEGGTSDSTNGNYGGALYIGEGSTANLLGGEFSGNSSARYGGAIAVNNSAALIKGISTFTGNSASHGVIYTIGDSASVNISEMEASGNTASSRGAFAYVGGGTLVVGNGTKASDNLSGGKPESIFLYKGTLQLKGAMDLGIVAVRSGYVINVADTISKLGEADAPATIDVTCADYMTTPLLTGTKSNIKAAAGVLKLKDSSYLFKGSNPESEYAGKYDGTLELDPNPFKVGDEGFATMEEALAYAAKQDGRATITMTSNVTFEEPVTYTVASNVDFNITNDITITGPLTLDGQNEERDWPLFTVNNKLTLNHGVTLCNFNDLGTAGGGYGAAIRVSGGKEAVLDEVTIRNCTNARGAVYSNNGSAILTVSNSLFENNTSDKDGGGAIYGYTGTGAACIVTVSNTTFRNNTSTTNGGALYFTGEKGDQKVTNCVFEGNTAESSGAAIYNNKGTVTVDGCTFTDNKVGEEIADITTNVGTVKLAGSVGVNEIALLEGAVIELDGNTSFTGKVGVSSSDVKKQILTGSDVAEKYTNFEARGEEQYIDEKGVLHGIMTVASVAGVGYTSLDAALEAASKNTGITDVILLEDAEFTSAKTFQVNGKTRMRVNAGKDITISGPVTFDGQDLDASCLLFYANGGTLTLKDVTVTNYRNTKGSGDNNSYGAMRADAAGTLNLENVTINAVAAQRGPFYVTGSTMNVKNCTFTNNEAIKSTYGGAISLYGAATATIEGTTFKGNSATSDGGAIYLTSTGATAIISDSTFEDNYATNYGGAIRAMNSAKELSLTNCTITGNGTGKYTGTAIYSDVATTVDSCTIKDNTATISVDKNSELIIYDKGTLILKGENDIERLALSTNNKSTVQLDGVVTGTVVVWCSDYTKYASTAFMSGAKLAESLAAFSVVDADYEFTADGCIESVSLTSLFEAPEISVPDPLKAMQEAMSGELLAAEEEPAEAPVETVVEETVVEAAPVEAETPAEETPAEAAPVEETVVAAPATEETVEIIPEA